MYVMGSVNKLNDLRDRKFLNKLLEQGDLGYFDYELAEFFGWKLIAVRSTAGSLQKRNLVNVVDTSKGWYICSNEQSGEDKKTRAKTK